MKESFRKTAVAVALLFATLSSAHGVAAAEGPRNVDARLVAYLTRGQGEAGEKGFLIDALKRVQVIKLRYRKEDPISPGPEAHNLEIKRQEKICLSKAAYRQNSLAVYPDGKHYPEIVAVFSAFQHDPRPDQWLETMKAPIQAGYDLKNVNIVFIPDVEVLRQSLARCQAAAGAFVGKLELLKPECRQLRSLDARNLKPGTWKEDGRPEYPSFRYNHDFAWKPKEPVKQSDEWCEITLQFGPMTGVPGQPAMDSGGREYPMQGLSVSWGASSADSRFNEHIRRLVEVSLKPLDGLENELQRKRDGTTTGSTPTR